MLGVANDIVGILRTWKVRWSGIENYAMGAGFRAHQIGEVAGVVKSQLWLALRMVSRVVPPSAARKHVFGYGGSMTKDQIIEMVRDGLGYTINGEHEADAGVVARYTFDQRVAEEREIEK